MAKQSSRNLALERRKALSEGGKKSTSLSGSSPSRVRTAEDARLTRTDASFVQFPTNIVISPGRPAKVSGQHPLNS